MKLLFLYKTTCITYKSEPGYIQYSFLDAVEFKEDISDLVVFESTEWMHDSFFYELIDETNI